MWSFFYLDLWFLHCRDIKQTEFGRFCATCTLLSAVKFAVRPNALLLQCSGCRYRASKMYCMPSSHIAAFHWQICELCSLELSVETITWSFLCLEWTAPYLQSEGDCWHWQTSYIHCALVHWWLSLLVLQRVVTVQETEVALQQCGQANTC